ncbi:S41 family peptidase [Methylomonas sp. MED-D]|uniref:S41 family peptidase n=1 Tax=Methylomonas sp. MED-D TaxID=3418768 RepID=UPI003D007F0D
MNYRALKKQIIIIILSFPLSFSISAKDRQIYKPLGPQGLTEIFNKIEKEHLLPIDQSTIFKQGIAALSNFDNDFKFTHTESEIVISYKNQQMKYNINAPLSIGDLIYKIINDTKSLSKLISYIDLNTLETSIIDRAVFSIDGRSYFQQDFRGTTQQEAGRNNFRNSKFHRTDESNITFAQEVKNDILYIRIVDFYNGFERVNETIFSEKLKYNPTLFDIVIDIRGNTGGSLDVIGLYLDLFITDSVVIQESNRTQVPKPEIRTGTATKFPKNRIILLVDGQTSSGAEAFALALRDLRNAKIVGTRTLGDAFVLTVFPLHNGNALAVTTYKLLDYKGDFLPNGGINPDICTNMLESECAKNIYSGPRGSNEDMDFLAAKNYLERTRNILTNQTQPPAESGD